MRCGSQKHSMLEMRHDPADEPGVFGILRVAADGGGSGLVRFVDD